MATLFSTPLGTMISINVTREKANLVDKVAQTSDLSLRLHILFEIGFDESEPLFDTAFDISASLRDIPENCVESVSTIKQRDARAVEIYGTTKTGTYSL